jgi:hypothetical protein
VIEPISHDGIVLAYLLRCGELPEQTTYWTPDEATLQVGHVVYPAGSEIPRHAHLPLSRSIVGTGEVLLVQRGRCDVDIYDDNRHLVTTRELRVGDILIAITGGHGFRVLEDTVLLEVKQGPYAGGGADKERF